MISEARNMTIAIKFERDDWLNGLARSMNTVIKKLPWTTRKFDGEAKEWIIQPTAKNRAALRKCYDAWENDLPFHWGTEDPAVETHVEEFMEQFN